MKIYLGMLHKKLLKTSVIFFTLISFSSFASEYPKSREERISDEMGSIAGEDGIVFRPKHLRNDETASKSNKKVNKFLWEAARSVLKFMPLANSDFSSGLMNTDWYSTASDPNYGFKVEVLVLDNVISADAIEVNVYERRLKNGQWYNEPISKELSLKFEDQILRKAREIYQKSQN